MRKIIVGSLIGLIVFWVAVWVGTAFLGMYNPRLLTLRLALMLLGAIAAGAIIWFFSKQHKVQSPESAASAGNHSDLAPLFQEAERKLSAARLPQGSRIGTLPAVLVIGEPGNVKTSSVLNSGLQAELLAGHIYQDGAVAPTRLANLWFSRRMVFAEAGGSLLNDASLWKSFLKQLQPRRLAAAVGTKTQAPRAMLVCVDMDQVIAGGDALGALARNLRTRLGEAAEAFGIQLPVYTLFTKADRIPFFADFVRNFSEQETAQVLGATLPLRQDADTGTYVEKQREILQEAFDDLFFSLANERPESLSRENDPTHLPGAYEFPREFRKLRTPVVQFLVELCRPSQLTVAPFLRGFYFSGVRPIVIQEAAPVPQRSDAQLNKQEDVGATRMFRPGVSPASNLAAARPAINTRRVPQWLFLGRLFNDVLLADGAIAEASSASVKTSVLRRTLFACFAALCLVLCIGFTISFFRNRALEQRVGEAIHGSAVTVTPGSVASIESLRRLDALRQVLQTLTAYHRDGAPWSYRWGCTPATSSTRRCAVFTSTIFVSCFLAKHRIVYYNSCVACPPLLALLMVKPTTI